MMRSGAEPSLLLEVVDLDDDAVGIVVQLVAASLQFAAVVEDGGEIPAATRAGVHGAAALAERGEGLPVGGGGRRLAVADVVQEDVQRAGGGHGGVFLAHRPR